MRRAICFGLVAASFLACTKKSSDIPARREFPVNADINPCEDFYEYACSKVVSGFQLRDDRSRHVFSFSDSRERILEAKKKYLAELTSKKGLSPRAQELADVFKSCMNKKSAAQEEKEIVTGTLEKIGAVGTRAGFVKLMGQRVDSPHMSFVGFGALANHDNSDWNDLYLVSSLQSLPERSYYKKDEVVADFRQLVIAFFRTLKLSDPEKRADWVVAFEKQFTETYPLPKEWRDLYSKRTGITRAQLTAHFPTLALAGFLDRIPARTHIRHMTPDNFKFLEKALKTMPLDQLKSVYLFHELSGYLDDAYPDYFKQGFEFRKNHLGGPETRPVRKERCTKLVMGRFGKELDAEFLPVFFPDFPEGKFRRLARKVRKSIINGVKTNQWLSAGAKKEAIKKIKGARLQLVQPQNEGEWDFNPKADYSPDRIHANLKILDKNLIEKKIKEFQKPRNRDRWAMSPMTVNAYYSPPDNKFVMPIGILQYPFYDPKLSFEANLGSVGAVIGHELGHGIDDKGSKFDSRGKLRQWMTAKDVAEFQRRGAGMVAQFDAIGHNGKLTLGENIGDLVGVSFAYKTAFPDGEGTLEKKREFFLNYGRLWCNVTRPKYAAMLLKVDPHSSGKARVNEQVKHQPGFAQAFACKAGDPMTLADSKRVQIW